MGRTPSERPERLAQKLLQIRQELGLSQNEIIRRLGLEDKITREDISKYERGVRLPHLFTLPRYAQVANVWMDVLVDDALELPLRLPSDGRSGGVKRRTARPKGA